MTVVVIGRMESIVSSAVTVLREEGFDARGVTGTGAAIELIDGGGAGALVIGGGVGPLARRKLRRAAARRSVTVIQGAMRGQDVRGYVRQRIVPQLRAAGD
ncbi:hypothetical protein SAMN05216251_103351 [Actinacidiphila alni]|uniref:Uncharacterized protein n=1 Tax=Actinacidiphila alni TaxID=380248 RepID=A0A1I2B6X7_9ACTN|nr:hypothetical protein [Actinacidiphila alni]SFE51063.1 hypothetical protein SAMN05216251_103351 [Actinacidiphila alni]